MIKCAIVGATGLVGSMFLEVLEEKNLNIDEYVLFASSRSKGTKVNFLNKDYVVQELTEDSFVNSNFDYALFSAGGSISEKYIPIALQNNVIVIDNSSFFRMDKNVPLVVPEVNEKEIYNSKLIANPNCSTIQEVMVLKALDDKFKIKRVVVSTYQAVSGAGQKGIEDLVNTRNNLKQDKFLYNITNNCIPHIDIFLENNYTKEEVKMIEETKKILNLKELNITATCVRVPVLNSHSESINIEFMNEFEIDDVVKTLKDFRGITVIDDVKNNKYPINEIANNTDEVYVGRIRRDYSVKNGINAWIVADNIRKGAATNAVQILEKLIEKRK